MLCDATTYFNTRPLHRIIEEPSNIILASPSTKIVSIALGELNHYLPTPVALA